MPHNSHNFIKKNLPKKKHKILMMGAAYDKMLTICINSHQLNFSIC